ncbi:hypothetical protein EVAR_66386_1 [Eumeta japonica]|uniref:Uncharacterized protein n=1 Tax=Eumeta variegata TaxID=151549 RepID=A0A4C1ZMS4_EUMVA|nr:hypothetical protein EVAR_66386_1 [Eumeta japonica]
MLRRHEARAAPKRLSRQDTSRSSFMLRFVNVRSKDKFEIQKSYEIREKKRRESGAEARSMDVESNN